jgi:sugar/nucleoside kinase (ribokinase family)
MSERRFDVLGVGNAIVDVLSEVDDRLVESQGLIKGSMQLIEPNRAEEVYQGLKKPTVCSGGSAANTMVGLVSLGSKAAYVGKVADDDLGRAFRDDMTKIGVSFEVPAVPKKGDAGTGRCIVLVTPDAQRTMMTSLGVSARLSTEDIDPSLVKDAKVTYLEGYLFDPPEAKAAFIEAARLAHEAGGAVSLSLSDSFCVDRHRKAFQDLVDHHVDILFANEEEAISLVEAASLDEALRELTGRCRVAAVTRGAGGSVILEGEKVHEVPPAAVRRVVDTTGAGDLFAAGFLHGWCAGRTAAECGRIGSIAAAEVIGHVGARPQVRLAELL